jgi:hypothetical protein
MPWGTKFANIVVEVPGPVLRRGSGEPSTQCLLLRSGNPCCFPFRSALLVRHDDILHTVSDRIGVACIHHGVIIIVLKPVRAWQGFGQGSQPGTRPEMIASASLSLTLPRHNARAIDGMHGTGL